MFRNLVCWLFLVAIIVSGCHLQISTKHVVDTTNDDLSETDAGIPEEVIEEEEVDIPMRDDAAVPEEEVESPVGIVPVQEPEAEINEDDAALAKRIVRWKKKKDHGIWWECGKRYTAEEVVTVALEWATAINAAYEMTTYKLRSGKVVKVNKQEAVGVMIHETRFDRCGVGPFPREFAYKHKLLKKKKGTISHSLEDLEMVFTHPKFQGRKADIGPGQIVFRIGKGKDHIKWEEVVTYMSVEPGVAKVFTEMAFRGNLYNTRTPSDRWPGSKKHSWYTTKIMRYGAYIFNDNWYR